MKTIHFTMLFLALAFVTVLQAQTPTNDSPVGTWKWVNNATLTLKADSTVLRDGEPFGEWHWTDKAKREFVIVGPTKRVDTLTLSANGNEVSGVDNDGGPVSGTRSAAK